MTEVELALPGFTCSIAAPQKVIDSLEKFYPRSVSRLSDGATAATVFSVTNGKTGWELRRDGEIFGTYREISYALLALEGLAEKEVTSAASHRIALHAGAVATPLGAWLLAGDPDAGKTSSTFHCLQLGQAFLCEEVALYEPGRHTISPFPQTLALDRRFLDEYERHFQIGHGELWPLDRDIVRFVPARCSDEPVPLHSLLLPRYSPGSPTRIDTLQPADVLTEILGFCFEPGAGEEPLYDAIIGMLEQTRILRIRYGSTVDARRIYEQLLGSPATGPEAGSEQ